MLSACCIQLLIPVLRPSIIPNISFCLYFGRVFISASSDLDGLGGNFLAGTAFDACLSLESRSWRSCALGDRESDGSLRLLPLRDELRSGCGAPLGSCRSTVSRTAGCDLDGLGSGNEVCGFVDV